MTDSAPEPLIDPDESELDHDEDYNLDPGASPDDAGVPEVADDATPGSGIVPEPERAAMPTEEPVESDSFGVTEQEEADETPLDERLAAEEPDLGDDDDRDVTTVTGSGMHIERSEADALPLEEEPPEP